MKTSDFCNKWNELHGKNGYFQRIDPKHPLDFFIGISPNGYEELVLITLEEPAKLISSKALDVEKAIRKDKKWATQIYSVEKENQDVFARFCLDLMECSRNCKNEAEGLRYVTQRFQTWQHLFARFNETLSPSVIKGLIGELNFCELLIHEGYRKDQVLESWVGPEGADRDFVLAKVWFENKAISTGKDKVTISSLNQFDINSEGYLTVVYIDGSSNTDPRALSVKEYVHQFRKYLLDSPNALDLFEEKLLSIGYLDKACYEQMFFVVGKREYYLVDTSFPRLVPESVPHEIVSAQYELSIAGIKKWKVNGNDIWN